MKILLVHTPFDWKRPITTLPHLIRKVAGVFNNHASFEIDGVIYESDINGVVKVPLKEWAKNQTITVYDLSTPSLWIRTEEELNEVKKRATELVQKHKYDFMSLFVYQPIYLATGWYLGRGDRGASKRFYCFEYLAYTLKRAYWYRITPEQFNRFCDEFFKKTHANINIHDYIKEQQTQNNTMAQDYKIWWQPTKEMELVNLFPELDTTNAEYVNPTAEWVDGYNWVEQSLTPEQFAIVDNAANQLVAIDIKPKPYPPGHPLGR